MENKTYEPKGKVTLTQDRNRYTFLNVTVNNSGQGCSGSGTPYSEKFYEMLRDAGKHAARNLFRKGMGFGDYRLLNGKGYDCVKDRIIDGEKADARTVSEVNFAILNEMMRLKFGERAEILFGIKEGNGYYQVVIDGQLIVTSRFNPLCDYTIGDLIGTGNDISFDLQRRGLCTYRPKNGERINLDTWEVEKTVPLSVLEARSLTESIKSHGGMVAV
jgi:hypothetical protein